MYLFPNMLGVFIFDGNANVVDEILFKSIEDYRNKDDFISLRINKKAFLKTINENKFRRYMARFAKKALTKRVKIFLEFIKHA